MSRFFAPISIKELKEKINESRRSIRHLTPTVSKDLDKVEFGDENLDYESGYGSAEELVGYNTLPNGMAMLGVLAGGDWEWPIFFCIYFDGKKLRGYLPTEGNSWNTTTKKAFGNDRDADLKNAKKRWPDLYPPDEDIDEDEDIEPIGDAKAMAEDIMKRILPI